MNGKSAKKMLAVFLITMLPLVYAGCEVKVDDTTIDVTQDDSGTHISITTQSQWDSSKWDQSKWN